MVGVGAVSGALLLGLTCIASQHQHSVCTCLRFLLLFESLASLTPLGPFLIHQHSGCRWDLCKAIQ